MANAGGEPVSPNSSAERSGGGRVAVSRERMQLREAQRSRLSEVGWRGGMRAAPPATLVSTKQERLGLVESIHDICDATRRHNAWHLTSLGVRVECATRGQP
jgi:hypothetical protein